MDGQRIRERNRWDGGPQECAILGFSLANGSWTQVLWSLPDGNGETHNPTLNIGLEQAEEGKATRRARVNRMFGNKRGTSIPPPEGSW